MVLADIKAEKPNMCKFCLAVRSNFININDLNVGTTYHKNRELIVAQSLLREG